MTAKIETLRAPRQLSPWYVIGAGAALIAMLAVLTVTETDVTPTTRPAVEATVRAPADLVEMAAIKSAVAHEYMVERFGIPETVSSASSGTSEARAIWALKAGIAAEFLGERFGTAEVAPPVTEDALEAAVKARLVHGVLEASGSGSEKGHPVRRTG